MHNATHSAASPSSTKSAPPAAFRPNPHRLSFTSDPVPNTHTPTEEDREFFGYLFDSKGNPLPGAKITTWEEPADGDLDKLIRMATKGLAFEAESALEACNRVLKAVGAALPAAALQPGQSFPQLDQIPPEPALPLALPCDTESEGSMPALIERVKALVHLWESLPIAGFADLEPVPGLTLDRFREIGQDLASRTEDLTELLWDKMFCSAPLED
jgi:hypothetical protein